MYEGPYESDGYECTKEVSWDALADGMYSNLSSDTTLYDAIMVAMGFLIRHYYGKKT